MATAIYIGLVLIGYMGIIALILFMSSRQPARYRVVKNALGEYCLQSYECLTPEWVSFEGPGPRENYVKYGYVTIRKFDTLEAASQAYNTHMEFFHKQQDAELDAKLQKDLENTIVKIYKDKELAKNE